MNSHQSMMRKKNVEANRKEISVRVSREEKIILGEASKGSKEDRIETMDESDTCTGLKLNVPKERNGLERWRDFRLGQNAATPLAKRRSYTFS